MELPRPQPRREPRPDPYSRALQIVRRWPKTLRAEAKLAYEDLIDDARIEGRTINVHPATLSAKQGRSDASGRRWLNSLAEVKLIRIVDRTDGRWSVYLEDPAEVAQTLKLRFEGDLQLEFVFDEQEAAGDGTTAGELSELDGHFGSGLSESACVVPFPDAAKEGHRNTSMPDATVVGPSHPEDASKSPSESCAQPPSIGTAEARAQPPTEARAEASAEARADVHTAPSPRSRDFGTSERVSNNPTSVNFGNFGNLSTDVNRASGGGCEQAADVHAPPPTVFEQAVLRIATGALPAEERQRRIDEQLRRLWTAVADPKLRHKPTVRVAQALVDGYLQRRDVDELLEQLDACQKRGELRTARWSYFVGGAQSLFRRYDLDWETCKPKRLAK